MCEVCGCGDTEHAVAVNVATGKVIVVHDHAHSHPHMHEHVHADGTRHSHAHDGLHDHHDHHHHHKASVPQHAASLFELEARVLAKNDALAARNRAWLAERNLLAINLMGAPGAGKTALLERTIRETEAPLYVVEGDQATLNDGERIRAAGAAVVQVNTGTGCHLEADMVAKGWAELAPAVGSTLIVENVGNLVCPALFDLGEGRRVVVFSVTEGEDKPLKYPHMFRAADLVLLNKIDLLPYLEFDRDRAVDNVHALNADATVLDVSARSGEGMASWYAWLDQERSAAAKALQDPAHMSEPQGSRPERT
jgi:hydrogenase nickel incorporation protein HypB